MLDEALAGIDALVAATVLSPEDGREWRDQMRGERFGNRRAPVVPEVVRAAGAGLLGELLKDVNGPGVAFTRFNAALQALGELGAVDVEDWDARLSRQAGVLAAPELDALIDAAHEGGTEVELLGVFAGPAERVGGWRLELVVLFTDGVTCLLDRDAGATGVPWPGWQLSDDGAGSYAAQSDSRDLDDRLTFSAARPPQTGTELQLTAVGRPELAFRVRVPWTS